MLIHENIFCFLPNHRLLEDAYVLRDPFSPNSGHLILGGQCCLCSTDICVSQVQYWRVSDVRLDWHVWD